jgi:GT2 family glycosyltransferase
MTNAATRPDVELGLRDVCVVVVLHNSAEVITGSLAALPPEVEVIVVDNGSGDGGAQVAAEARPDLKLISSAGNLGFGGGCQLGADAATRKLLLFLNPDARIDAASILRLSMTLAEHPYAIVGPRLLDSGGTARPIRRKPDTRQDASWLLPFSTRWLPPRWRPQPELDCEAAYKVGLVEGACFLIRAEDLVALGGFDPDLFLYHEEASLAHRLRRRGGGAWYEPRASAIHIGQQSTAKARAFAAYHFYRSRVILERKVVGDAAGRMRSLLLLLAASIALLRALAHRILPARLSAVREAVAICVGVLAGMRQPIDSPYR